LLNALTKEIELRAEEASEFTIQTIYLGGGTPSLLNDTELQKIFHIIYEKYKINPHSEITLETNPDDITVDYLNQLQHVGINRLSIGIQSFFDEDLSWMNRAHTSSQSSKSIEQTIKSGFENFSIDLMYGLPGMTLEGWIKNLEKVREFEIPHLSCYSLTVEERTALSHRVKEHSIQLPEDSYTIQQMDALLNFCQVSQYEAYEISNFAKPGYRSRHNSSYWEGIPYFGFGPAAHSYNKNARRWNIANNALYIQALENKLPYFETEILTRANQCNEYLMLQIRRIEGIDKNYLENNFVEFFSLIMPQIVKQQELGNLIYQDGHYILSRKGRYIADEVSSNLFVN
jgi:oxygen-independent coproporphyrinogen-3 oxidase